MKTDKGRETVSEFRMRMALVHAYEKYVTGCVRDGKKASTFDEWVKTL